MVKIYCKVDGKEIPLVSTGTSPFIGAGQFGFKAYEWRRKFLNNLDAMVEILEASYQAGARGIEAIPIGKIMEASRIMTEVHDDYIVIGSTFPGSDPKIEELIDVNAKIIFTHGIVSDKKDDNLVKLVDDISSRGVIPGIAAHNPVPTFKYALENIPQVKVFLIPFNANGLFMGNQKNLEELVDNNKNCSFVGMKTLAAGKLNPKEAYKYISKHNICSVTIGMVTTEEAEISTKIALKALSK